jgi:hypothetical protein
MKVNEEKAVAILEAINDNKLPVTSSGFITDREYMEAFKTAVYTFNGEKLCRDVFMNLSPIARWYILLTQEYINGKNIADPLVAKTAESNVKNPDYFVKQLQKMQYEELSKSLLTQAFEATMNSVKFVMSTHVPWFMLNEHIGLYGSVVAKLAYTVMIQEHPPLGNYSIHQQLANDTRKQVIIPTSLRKS